MLGYQKVGRTFDERKILICFDLSNHVIGRDGIMASLTGFVALIQTMQRTDGLLQSGLRGQEVLEGRAAVEDEDRNGPERGHARHSTLVLLVRHRGFSSLEPGER